MASRVLLLLAFCICCFTYVLADIRCYSCTGYMSQCKETVDDSQGDVFKETCNSKCFLRMGEDGALYRGCFDGFMEVTELKYGYSGCRNQTWNRKSLQWCMCSTDLCNKDMMGMKRSDVRTDYVDDNFLKYDYNDMKYDQNAVQNDVVVQQYQYNGVNSYDAKENDGSSFMEAYAREAPMEDQYEEALFGLNDPSYGTRQNNYQEIKYMSPENPTYPRPYDGSQYYSRSNPQSGNSFDQAAYDFANKRYNQALADYEEHNPQYSRETGPAYNYNTQKPYNDAAYQQPAQVEAKTSNHVSSRLANKIRCNKSGYYQNPHDCRQFVACLMDPYSKTPVMHVMKCPEGLVWDNKKKICMEYSTTCNVVVTNYLDDDMNVVDNSVDITGYRSNQVIDEIHGNMGMVVEEEPKSADGYQDNSYGVSGDVNRELYSDGVYTADDATN